MIADKIRYEGVALTGECDKDTEDQSATACRRTVFGRWTAMMVLRFTSFPDLFIPTSICDHNDHCFDAAQGYCLETG